MPIDIHVSIEKLTAYGWVLATTPRPDGNWALNLPVSDVTTAHAKVADYLRHHRGIPGPTAAVPVGHSELIRFMDQELTPSEGALVFGEEPWFNWATGIPLDFEVRNQPLFAIMADIGNAAGLAPISRPRGIPGDACPETLAYYGRWRTTAHGMSHLLAREFLDYPWETSVPLVHGDPQLRAIGRSRLKRMMGFLVAQGPPNAVRMVFWFSNAKA